MDEVMCCGAVLIGLVRHFASFMCLVGSLDWRTDGGDTDTGVSNGQV